MSSARQASASHVILAWLRHAADDHVRVAAGLDLLQAVAVDQRVEVGVKTVEEPDQVARRGIAGPLGVAGDVGEQDGGVVVLVGNDVARRVFQAFGDRRRQDVGQQCLRPLVFGLHRLSGAPDFAQRVRNHRDDHDPGRDHREDEAQTECPIRLHASVVGNKQLERNDRRSAESRQHRRQDEVLAAEDQHHERRRDEVVERAGPSRCQGASTRW